MGILVPKHTNHGFTLVEVVIAMALAAITVGASIYGYTHSSRRAEWSGYSLAAHALAMQTIEQARASRWDPMSSYPDQLVQSNFPPRISLLDIPIRGTNVVYATNFTTISNVSTNPPLKMIRVDTVWRFVNNRLYSNTVVTYRSAAQ